ncbi:MAG: lactate utilization protein [Dehalococcoidia bacterium]
MAGISQNEFIDNLRRAMGRTGPVTEPDYLPLKLRRADQRQRVVTIEARVQARRTDLLNHLASTASRQGWQVQRAVSSEDVVEYVVALAREKHAGLIVRSNHEVFKRVSLDAALRTQGARVVTVAAGRGTNRTELRDEMARADLGITGVDYAIAETGTCVLVPRQGVSRVVSLLPPLHVAIVEAHQVYESLDDLFALRRLAFIQGRGDMGSYLSLISGPSRTGDIEQTIVTGVHGPMEVHMVILDQA